MRDGKIGIMNENHDRKYELCTAWQRETKKEEMYGTFVCQDQRPG